MVPLSFWLFLVEFYILEEYCLLFFIVLALAAGGVLVLGVGGRVLLSYLFTLVVTAMALETIFLNIYLNLVKVDSQLLFLNKFLLG